MAFVFALFLYILLYNLSWGDILFAWKLLIFGETKIDKEVAGTQKPDLHSFIMKQR